MFEHCRRIKMSMLPVVLVAAVAAPASAAPRPVPPSPYLGVVYRYADALLQHGRDTHGPQSTSLILSALDRKSLAPLTNRPKAPSGVLESARAGEPDGLLVGASPLHDANLLRLLYTLSELSSKPVYRDAADGELRWFLQNTALTKTRGAPWDDGFLWNVLTDQPIRVADTSRGPNRAWLLWDRSFELAPDVSKQWALAARQQHSTGDISPHRLGFALRAMSSAYQQTHDEALLGEMEKLLEPLENKSLELVKSTGATGGSSEQSPASWLSAAIDCDGASRRVALPLADRLRSVSKRCDVIFLSVSHDLQRRNGFSSRLQSSDATPVTSLWNASLSEPTTAHVAMLCVSRYENIGSSLNIRYRELIHAAADCYADSLPSDGDDTWPLTFGQAISLQLAAWRSTSRQQYLDRAIKLADIAVQTFWTESPLPKASSKSDHYESITGSDTLGLALVELHLTILGITAVRCPPNTIDR